MDFHIQYLVVQFTCCLHEFWKTTSKSDFSNEDSTEPAVNQSTIGEWKSPVIRRQVKSMGFLSVSNSVMRSL